MNKDKIQAAQRLSAEITNFTECYSGCELWGDIDGCVSAEALIEFLINNPDLPVIADNIEKINKQL